MARLHYPPSQYNTGVHSPGVKQPGARLRINWAIPPRLHTPSCCGQGHMYLLPRLSHSTVS